MRFLDTNVLVRFLIGTPPEQFRNSVQLLRSVERGAEQVVTNYIVIFETVWVLNRSYTVPMSRVRDVVLEIINLENLRLADKHLYARAFDLAVDLNIPFADAFSAVFMEVEGLTEVYTWDRHFDRVPGITRIEPGSEPRE